MQITFRRRVTTLVLAPALVLALAWAGLALATALASTMATCMGPGCLASFG